MLAVKLKLCKYCNKLAVPKVLVNPMEAKTVDRTMCQASFHDGVSRPLSETS